MFDIIVCDKNQEIELSQNATFNIILRDVIKNESRVLSVHTGPL